MQPETQIFAEDSCLKYQFESQNVGGEVHDASVRDVEKAEVKDHDASITGRTVVGTHGKENGDGVLGSVHPDSDSSSVTAIDGVDGIIKEDDFPEGGLKG